ncbi:hypothetical protein C8R44DRAFT_743122 [Mycena epipterygia]|nr:hypothetical protein C8R44DRAFT_743122 [Mycena epipterygia]
MFESCNVDTSKTLRGGELARTKKGRNKPKSMEEAVRRYQDRPETSLRNSDVALYQHVSLRMRTWKRIGKNIQAPTETSVRKGMLRIEEITRRKQKINEEVGHFNGTKRAQKQPREMPQIEEERSKEEIEAMVDLHSGASWYWTINMAQAKLFKSSQT